MNATCLAWPVLDCVLPLDGAGTVAVSTGCFQDYTNCILCSPGGAVVLWVFDLFGSFIFIINKR